MESPCYKERIWDGGGGRQNTMSKEQKQERARGEENTSSPIRAARGRSERDEVQEPDPELPEGCGLILRLQVGHCQMFPWKGPTG